MKLPGSIDESGNFFSLLDSESRIPEARVIHIHRLIKDLHRVVIRTRHDRKAMRYLQRLQQLMEPLRDVTTVLLIEPIPITYKHTNLHAALNDVTGMLTCEHLWMPSVEIDLGIGIVHIAKRTFQRPLQRLLIPIDHRTRHTAGRTEQIGMLKRQVSFACANKRFRSLSTAAATTPSLST